MRRFIVHFVFDDTHPDAVSETFECEAWNEAHAGVQCEAAHPGCQVLYFDDITND